MKNKERAIKIKLLEEIKAELWKDFETLVQASNTMEKLNIYDLQLKEMTSMQLAAYHIADLRLNKILYPLYWEIQQEEKESVTQKHALTT